LRPFYFQPTFYKYKDQLCNGIQIHVDHHAYVPPEFKPYRIVALSFKAIRNLYPNYELWRDFAYEYVFDRLAIDVITGCETLRKWVDNPKSTIAEFEAFLSADEAKWKAKVKDVLIYT
jgi:uncharacterized protein YbbC (DUF1343 family)